HRDPKSYSGALEDPKRDLYQKPQEVIMALGLKPGEVIADIGAGSGYFTFRLAHHVGDTGKVYAVDENSDMIRHINRRIRELKVTNVVSILAILMTRCFRKDNQTKYLSLMKQKLKPGGEIIMIDFHKKELPVGPPMQMKIARRI